MTDPMMGILKRPFDIAEEGWNHEKKTRLFSHCYDTREGLAWVGKNLFGPSRKNPRGTRFIPRKSCLNPVSRQIKLAFVGDIMPARTRELRVGSDVSKFLSDADFVVANFEGTITSEKCRHVFMSQSHSIEILDSLALFFPPEKTILSCANNHTGDYGWSEFCKSYELLRNRGFQVMGRRDEPSVAIHDKINISTCTVWSNQKCSYVSSFRDVHTLHDKGAKFNLLFPHWGHELELYPRASQVEECRSLLQQWDMIIGHHSHCPQPIVAYPADEGWKLAAYSLGNFSFVYNIDSYLNGLIIKVELGPRDNGQWAVGWVEWSFTLLHFSGKSNEIRLSEQCELFPLAGE